MRQILEGKWYDTATAELVYSGCDAYLNNQRDYYRTKKGKFFVHYVEVGKMELCTEKFMKELLGKYAPDKYVLYFEDVEEG